jgi:hypothetical protein
VTMSDDDGDVPFVSTAPLSFSDCLTGRRVSLVIVFDDGKLQSHQELRAQIMRPLKFIKYQKSFFFAHQRRYALHNSSFRLRDIRGSFQHCVYWSEFCFRRRLPGLHSRAQPCVRVENARDFAVCKSSRRNCIHVQLS